MTRLDTCGAVCIRVEFGGSPPLNRVFLDESRLYKGEYRTSWLGGVPKPTLDLDLV
jgi:hypothetical protein